MFPVAEANSTQIDEIAKRLAERVYKGDKILSDRALLRATATELMRGVQKGYGKVDWNAPDTKTIEHLTENVYQFAAAKNYHELRDMTDAVRDGDKVRSFNDFSKQVDDIAKKYNRDWLRTEYNQAIAASQSAARWDDFKRNQKDMPYLQYQCVMDGNTRPEHAALHGVIKRMDDPFWTQYMPPNGWGCRCEALQMPGSSYKETPDTKIQLPNVSQMFRINFGQQATAFPPGHAYFKRFPKEYEHQAKEMSRQEVRRILNNAEDAKRLKADKNYKDVVFDYANGGLKATHKGHNFDKKGGKYEKHSQNAGYKDGHKVIFGNEFSQIIGERFTEGKWDDKFFEVAGRETATENNILRGLKHCASKRATQIAVLDFPNGEFSQENFNRAIKRYNGLEKLKDGQFLGFEKIICIQNETIIYELDI